MARYAMMFPSEQVPRKHSIANATGVFLCPKNCIPVRRKVRCSSFMLRGTPVLATGFRGHDEQRTLRVR